MQLSVILALVGVAFAAALPLEAPVPVTDTEEVVQAKAEFRALYDAAAAAAAAGEVPAVVVPEGAPVPVADTEDVVAAKTAFQAAFDAAIANDGVLPEVIIPAGAPESVVDTEEVAEAKASFKAAFDAAAAAAEAAPDGAISTATGVLSPFYTNTYPFGAYGIHSPVFAGTPYFAGAPHVVAPAVTKTTVFGSPLTYNAFLPSPFGGLHTPFIQYVAAAEE